MDVLVVAFSVLSQDGEEFSEFVLFERQESRHNDPVNIFITRLLSETPSIVIEPISSCIHDLTELQLLDSGLQVIKLDAIEEAFPLIIVLIFSVYLLSLDVHEAGGSIWLRARYGLIPSIDVFIPGVGWCHLHPGGVGV